MAEDLVGKVLNFFSGDSNMNLSDKELILRQRLKELGENKYAKFYKSKTDEADPSLGLFFHSLYRMIMPIRVFMKDVAKTTKLRQIVLEVFMDPAIKEMVKRLNPAGIDERAKTTSPEELTKEIRLDLEKITLGFDSNHINGVNRCYNLVMFLFQLANYDYPALLKKFDPNFTEGPYGADPKFSSVKIMPIAKDLADFLAVTQGLSPDNDWKTILKLLKICSGEDLISDNQFAQILIGLRDVINSNILQLMVQCASKNPVWTCKPMIPDEHIAEAWLDARISKARESIAKINLTEKSKQIEVLLKEIFFGGDLERLDYYTTGKSNTFRKRGLSYFTYADGLNYLAVFLDEYVEKTIRELCDILLIRGQWTNNTSSKEVSEVYHQLLELPASLSQLDESLSDDGSNGSRLKASLLRVDKDQTQARYINSIIDNVNETAQELLNNAAQYLSVIEKHLKNLVDDIQKKHPELIINWRELNSVSKAPLLQQMAEEQRRVNCFVQLMHLCASI